MKIYLAYLLGSIAAFVVTITLLSSTSSAGEKAVGIAGVAPMAVASIYWAVRAAIENERVKPCSKTE